MKRATFEDAAATYDDKLAMIMAVGDATIKEASRALEECNGDVDGALTLVYDRAHDCNKESNNLKICRDAKRILWLAKFWVSTQMIAGKLIAN
jgi:hypothetical protein